MKRIFIHSVLGLLLLATGALAQSMPDPRDVQRGNPTISGIRVPAGYEQLSLTDNSAHALASIPASKGGLAVTLLVISVESVGVRFRDDTVDPTAAIGMPIAAGASYIYTGDPSMLKFIRQTSSTATVNILYYY